MIITLVIVFFFALLSFTKQSTSFCHTELGIEKKFDLENVDVLVGENKTLQLKFKTVMKLDEYFWFFTWYNKVLFLIYFNLWLWDKKNIKIFYNNTNNFYNEKYCLRITCNCSSCKTTTSYFFYKYLHKCLNITSIYICMLK